MYLKSSKITKHTFFLNLSQKMKITQMRCEVQTRICTAFSHGFYVSVVMSDPFLSTKISPQIMEFSPLE